MKGKVCGLAIFAAKNEPPQYVEQGLLLEGLGMKGDRHCKGGEKQISLITKDAAAWKQSQKTEGLCFKKFKANLVIDGLLAEDMSKDTVMDVGDAVIQVTAVKNCYDECSFVTEGKPCILRTHGLFAKVIKSGEIKHGDRVQIKE